MKLMDTTMLFLATLWLLGLPVMADATVPTELTELWRRANQQFQTAQGQEDYALAALYFETIVTKGVRNGYLYYNLGNAYLKADRLGEAIVNYRRAERYLADDAELRENLRYARSLLKVTFVVPGPSQFLHYLWFWHHCAWSIRWYLLLLCYSGCWICLLVRLIRRSGSCAVWLTLCGLGVLAFGSSLGYETWLERTYPPAVLVGNDSVIRKGDGDRYESLYAQNSIVSGVEVRVVETRGEWCKVELPDQLYGWVKKSKINLIGD